MTIQSALNNDFEDFYISYVHKGTFVGIQLLFSIDFQGENKLYGIIDFVNLDNGKYLIKPRNADGITVDLSQEN